MIACKFFGELTNNQSVRNRLGERISQIKFAPPIDKTNQLFSELNSKNSAFFNTFPIRSCGLDISRMKEKTELYQPGDKGFVMK